MKVKHLLISFSLLLLVNLAYSQNTYDIVFSGNDRDQACQSCYQAISQKPKEVKFSIKREQSKLFFEVNDKNWFNNLFKNSGDGVAIDIVLKDKYNCNKESIEKSQIRGFLIKPIYSNQLKSGLKPNSENTFRTYVGEIPEGFLNDELEFNILFLGNKNFCAINNFY